MTYIVDKMIKEMNDKDCGFVEQDIYEERQITPFTRAKVLLHKKGKYIPFREAEKLGLVERPKLP
jgi:hypothetical protein